MKSNTPIIDPPHPKPRNYSEGELLPHPWQADRALGFPPLFLFLFLFSIFCFS